ncbi:MAG TPA: histidinol dehydrogenase [Ignavibacteriales bacterium]|nr:histidinol dehydrogenase [Ignavibacteriales bacterium]
MKIYNFRNLDPKEKESLLRRPAIDLSKSFEAVRPILSEIKTMGLEAALKYAAKFDHFSGENLLVSRAEFDEAEKNLDSEVKRAIKKAADNIQKFHIKQMPKPYATETMEGIFCSREYRAIENVGLYIPGGSAVLPSTMLMLGIPARIAGCKRIVAVSPSKDNRVNDALLYAAKYLEITEFYKIGGAQAIGLLAYGDKEFPKVNKIFGPGNQYVTAAKLLVSIDLEGCPIDMPAGPSEVLVIADESSEPSFIAADLLSQAEHGSDSQVVLVTTSQKVLSGVLEQLELQLQLLPRKDTAIKALESSFALVTENVEDAFTFSNMYAPEHLILHLEEPEQYKALVNNAGSVFLGGYSPESAGDYASGTNHSLPTYGYAKSFGGVTVESFMKTMTFQKLTREGLKSISGAVETLAETESLRAHKNAVTIRLNQL